MQRELEAFFVKPTSERYHSAREAVISDSAFRIDYADILRLTSLVRARRMSEAQLELDLLLPAWALSPRIHHVGSQLANYFHDREDAELFQFMEQACLDGLCQSGGGSIEDPYAAIYPTDPLDVLRELGETPVTQSVRRGDCLLDVFYCQSGAEVAFSIGVSSPSVAVAKVRPASRPEVVNFT